MNDERGDGSLRAARRAQWRGLAELARDPSLLDEMSREFAPGVDEAPDAASRRDLLRLMGASFALAGLSACSRAPSESIRPYAVQPPEVMPGVPLRYATAMTIDGYARGLVVESHEGRPTKVEGNPDHQATFGATGVLEQASVLSVYDVDRARGITHDGQPATWDALTRTLMGTMGTGRGVCFVLEPTGSPLIADQVARIRARLPDARVYFHGAIGRESTWEGARIALGRPLETHVDLRQADVILALDADFVSRGPSALRLSRQLADGRRPSSPSSPMNRLYAAEPLLSVTGAAADHRLRLRARDVLPLAAAILAEIGDAQAASPAAPPASLAAELARLRPPVSVHDAWIRAVARDLTAHRGRSAVIAGDDQPAAVHAIAHAINARLGNVGRTVTHTESPILDAGLPSHDLRSLVLALNRDEVDTLVIVGGNPAYTAFADFDFGQAMRKARESVYLGAHRNETAAAARWFVPAAHYLEEWGDARAVDGTISIVQPLLMPLTDGRTPSQLLAVYLEQGALSPHDLLTEMWRRTRNDFDAMWSASLDRGIVPDTAFSPVEAPNLAWAALRDHLAQQTLESAGKRATLEIVHRADSRVHDGAMANNPWLQELPDPITKLTWDNAALLSPATAARLGVTDGDLLRLEVNGGKARWTEAPALIAPGHADDTIAIALGYGRTGEESIARDIGVNAYALRTSSSPYFNEVAEATVAGGKHSFAITQLHHSLEGRDEDIYLHTTLAEYRQNPRFARETSTPKKSLYSSSSRGEAPRQWGMVIDLNACTGCSACVVACQAENNVPVVGKAGVHKRREMHWIRIDRYFIGSAEAAEALVQPMLCQHCEKAPCEYVCPVNATVHSADGLNQMVYNRCVGTRFCSNNCPYKVRRFNWFDYHQDEKATVALQHNPDVTVRARGVMEKCTYCVQRIREAEIKASIERRGVRDGEVVTACAQACASGAITFGDIRDPGAAVSKLRASDRAFGVLHSLGNAPRTQYLARIKNPNPEIA